MIAGGGAFSSRRSCFPTLFFFLFFHALSPPTHDKVPVVLHELQGMFFEEREQTETKNGRVSWSIGFRCLVCSKN